jgi:hypothetical protein
VRCDAYLLRSVVELMQSLITRSGFCQSQILSRKLSCSVCLSFNSSIYPCIHPSTHQHAMQDVFRFFVDVRRDSLGGGSGYCEAFTATGQHKQRRIDYIHVSSGVRTHDPCIQRKGYSLRRGSQRHSDRLLTALQIFNMTVPYNNANTCRHGCLPDKG